MELVYCEDTLWEWLNQQNSYMNGIKMHYKK